MYAFKAGDRVRLSTNFRKSESEPFGFFFGNHIRAVGDNVGTVMGQMDEEYPEVEVDWGGIPGVVPYEGTKYGYHPLDLMPELIDIAPSEYGNDGYRGKYELVEETETEVCVDVGSGKLVWFMRQRIVLDFKINIIAVTTGAVSSTRVE